MLWLGLAQAVLFTPSAPARAGDTPACSATTPQDMLAAVPACQKDAAFLAALGQLLNSQGRYLEATDHLERALMLDPGLKDAQLSYAIALAGTGDVSSATALLDDLLADPACPPICADSLPGKGLRWRMWVCRSAGKDISLCPPGWALTATCWVRPTCPAWL